MKAIVRLMEYLDYKDIKPTRFEKEIGLSNGYLGTQLRRNADLGEGIINKIVDNSLDLSIVWLLTGNGKMLNEKNRSGSQILKRKKDEETRPRIPFDAKAGSLSLVLDNLAAEYCEQIAVIKSFSKYDFTMLVKGNSMLPEFYPGDELVCLYIKLSDFIQWGRFHILDTSQGIIVKRIFDDGEYILCKSENTESYKNFRIHKSEVYNLALVIGLVRRY